MNHDIKNTSYFIRLLAAVESKPILDRNHKFQTQLKHINLKTRKLTCENAKNKQTKNSMSAII